MGIRNVFKTKKGAAEQAIGPDLAAVLPANAKPWYRTKHLLALNLLLCLPLISSSAVGYDASMMNGLQSLDQWRQYFDHPGAPILGTINAVYPIGKVLMILPITWLGDRYGRRVPIMIGLVLLVLFAILQSASQNIAMFIVSRFLIGGSTIAIAQPSPILITELAYPTHRGKITSLYNSMLYLGSILAAWTTYGTFKLSSTWSWRVPSAIQAGFPIIQLCGIYFLPESPRWLVSKGRSEEARRILTKYHAGGDESSPLVDYEMNEIEEYIRLESMVNSKSSYKDLLRTKANRHRALLAVILGVFNQWTGISVVTYYLTLVLDTIGITTSKEQTLINGILQLFNFAATIFAGSLMVDRIGRRPLLLISVGGLFVSFVCWTVLTARFVATEDAGLGHAVLGFIFIAYFFFDIAWTPLMYAYTVEIFPFTLRSRGLSTALMSTNLALIIAQFVNPIGLARIAWKYYIVFCVILAVLFWVIYFLFPETKGRTLEEIAEIFDGTEEIAREAGIMTEGVRMADIEASDSKIGTSRAKTDDDSLEK